MVGTKLKYVKAERMDRPGQAVGEVSHRSLALGGDVCVEDKTRRIPPTLNTTSGSLDYADDAPIGRDCICDLEHISESILHDLRNPVAAILGAAEMIVDVDLPPARVKRLAGNIYSASRRIQGSCRTWAMSPAARSARRRPPACMRSRWQPANRYPGAPSSAARHWPSESSGRSRRLWSAVGCSEPS
jgi:hypothetical protein